MANETLKQNNFLLLAPALTTEAPTSFGILAAILKAEGFKVSAIVNTFKQPLNNTDYIEAVRQNRTKIVGISMLTIQVLKIYDLIRLLKKEGCLVVVGGPHATDMPEEPLNFGADIVVRGEGEETLRELCAYWNDSKNLRLQDIKGITFRNEDGSLTSTPNRSRLDITKLPPPDFNIFQKNLFTTDEGLLKGFHRIYTSRGCPAHCTFCDWAVFGQRVQFAPIPKVMEEIQRRVDNYGITSFTIADDCFTVKRRHVYEFCEAIIKIKPPLIWRCVSRANLVDAEMLKIIKEAGCHSIGFGLESGDAETLKRVEKGVKLEDNILAPKLAAEAGLQVFGCLMTGFPWEDPSHVQNTINLIRALKDYVYLFQISGALTPYPGTAIYKEFAQQYGFEKFWLKPELQLHVDQIYQNSTNPYATSTFYQRNFFDDTHIQEDTFFQYSKEYKQKVTELVFEIGRHNLSSLYPNNRLKPLFIKILSKISWLCYNIFPNLEKNIIGRVFKTPRGNRTKAEVLRDRKRGFVKNKQDVDIGTKLKNYPPNI